LKNGSRQGAKEPRRKGSKQRQEGQALNFLVLAFLLCAFAPWRLGVSLFNLLNLPNLRIASLYSLRG
jgi:hypothetical protein